MTVIKNSISGKFFWFFTLACHFLILFILYNRFGFNFSNEADKYITAATKISLSNVSDVLQHQWFSSTYIIFVAIGLQLGLSLKTVLFVQYLVSLLGYYYFYKFLVSCSFFSKSYSRICMFLVLCCPIIFYWQLTLFSESFFIALSMIATYFAFNSMAKKNIVLTVLFALLLMFCRPVGVFYVLALLYVVMKINKVKPASILTAGSFFILVLLTVFVFPLHYKGIALPVFQGSVICGYPLYPDAILPEGNYTLMNVYSALIEQRGWGEWFVLFFRKAISFFTLTRPYYSTSHNLINAAHYIFLLVALYSFYRLKKERLHCLVTNFVMVVTFSGALLTVLFYNEWSERYIVPLFPFFILLFVLFISKTRKEVAV